MPPQARLSGPINSKLGALIHSWSIPASPEICVGATEFCASLCYAHKGHFNHQTVKDRYLQNYEFSKSSGFPQWMRSAISAQYVRVLRVHVSGDFYSAAYARKWVRIVSQCPEVIFFAYSRSWRLPDLLADLRKLGELDNMHLWWSADRETGPPPKDGMRVAYLADPNGHIIGAKDCDLIFRPHPRGIIKKKIDGVQVCPVETGLDLGVTCSSCAICWQSKEGASVEDLRTALPIVA